MKFFGAKDSLEPPRRVSVRGWLAGRPSVGPTAAAKRRHLAYLLTERGHHIFVEAGTYRGATTAYFAKRAGRVISVELHDGLFAAARKRFARYPNVTLLNGDSLVEVPKAVAACESPPLVFLDGHFSGPGTAKGQLVEPAELTLGRLAKVAPPGTTIVVDDLRLFGSGRPGFPQLDAVTAAARSAFPHSVIRAGLDSIVIET